MAASEANTKIAAAPGGPSSSSPAATGEAKARQNSWEALLKRATQRRVYEDSTLIVLGNTNCGKSSILKSFPGIVRNPDHPYVADYSYIKVKNRFEVDSEETLAHMAVWQLDNPERKGLIPTFLKSSGLDKAIFMIVLDMSKPWSLYESLQTWLGVVEDTSKQLMKDMDEEESKALKLRVSKYVQNFVDASFTEGKGGKDQLSTGGESKIDPSIPSLNTGIPIVIVGAKGDYFSSYLQKESSAGDKFEFATRRLRQSALAYGATLTFASIVAEGTNLQLIQDYIFHRMYEFPLKHKAQAASTVDSFGLYIPSGFDSDELIESVRPAKSTFGDSLEFEKVFPNPNKESKKQSQEEKVKALKNSQFYKLLQQKLSSGSRTPKSKSSKSDSSKPRTPGSGSKSSSKSGGKSNPKSNQAVRQFFQSLLATGKQGASGSKHSASGSKSANTLAPPKK